jgi:hypothetical protein
MDVFCRVDQDASNPDDLETDLAVANIIRMQSLNEASTPDHSMIQSDFERTEIPLTSVQERFYQSNYDATTPHTGKKNFGLDISEKYNHSVETLSLKNTTQAKDFFNPHFSNRSVHEGFPSKSIQDGDNQVEHSHLQKHRVEIPEQGFNSWLTVEIQKALEVKKTDIQLNLQSSTPSRSIPSRYGYQPN